jgi:ubiquinone/menaquinone biosynthesis C-methylase UbiE
MKYFSHNTAAERYARGRPYFHPVAIQNLIASSKKVHFRHALDVATGTGLGAKALLEVCGSVTGCDISKEMLEFARATAPAATLLESPAETLPFPDASFDVITTFLAFHWFDKPRFLQEAKRVLEPGGHLMICNHHFTSELEGQPEFKTWVTDFYANYPAMPRHESKFDFKDAAQLGFELIDETRFDHSFSMNAEELALYISTQSNIIAKVEQGVERLEDVLETIRSGADQFLGGARGEIGFRGVTQILKSV